MTDREYEFRRMLSNCLLTAAGVCLLYDCLKVPNLLNKTRVEIARKVHNSYVVAEVKDIDSDGDLDVRVMGEGIEYEDNGREKEMKFEDMTFTNVDGLYIRPIEEVDKNYKLK